LAELSVVIPTYNTSAFLADAVDSALAQEGTRAEVIVVDDGSTDATPALLERYGDRITVIRQENRGLPAARNRGIAASSSTFVAFLDADDAWEPHKSLKQLAYMREHPDCGLVFCDAYRIDEQGRRVGGVMIGDLDLDDGRCVGRLFQTNFIVVPGTMVRRSVLEAVGGFDESLPSVEDYDLWLRIAAVSTIGMLPEALARYRVHGGQMSGNRERMLAAELRVLRNALDRSPEIQRLPPAKVSRRFARLYDESGWWDLREGLLARASGKFARAVRADPLWPRPYAHLLETALSAIGVRRRGTS
jgi:glycosyltransferase involved in cell wall biosynthesis